MRKPSLWMVGCALMLTLVGCTTSEQADPKEPIEQPTVSDPEQPVESPTDNEAEPTQEEEAAETDSDEEPVTETEPPIEEEPVVEQEPATEPVQPTELNGQANLELDTLVLVNKQIALPSDYQPSDLVTANIDFVDSATGERKMLRKEAARAIESLMKDAKASGVELKGTSAFRTYAYQVQLFNAYVARDGKDKAMKYSAPPGHSEHQTGLAIDISSASVGYQLTQEFEQTTEGKWLADNAHKYGFIIRYQRAYETETGYMYEPWHLRYIGVDHATNVHKTNVPFERYLEQLMD